MSQVRKADRPHRAKAPAQAGRAPQGRASQHAPCARSAQANGGHIAVHIGAKAGNTGQGRNQASRQDGTPATRRRCSRDTSKALAKASRKPFALSESPPYDSKREMWAKTAKCTIEGRRARHSKHLRARFRPCSLQKVSFNSFGKPFAGTAIVHFAVFVHLLEKRLYSAYAKTLCKDGPARMKLLQGRAFEDVRLSEEEKLEPGANMAARIRSKHGLGYGRDSVAASIRWRGRKADATRKHVIRRPNATSRPLGSDRHRPCRPHKPPAPLSAVAGAKRHPQPRTQTSFAPGQLRATRPSHPCFRAAREGTCWKRAPTGLLELTRRAPRERTYRKRAPTFRLRRFRHTYSFLIAILASPTTAASAATITVSPGYMSVSSLTTSMRSSSFGETAMIRLCSGMSTSPTGTPSPSS